MYRLTPFALAFVFLPLDLILAQEERHYYREVLDDPYISRSVSHRTYSKAYHYQTDGFSITQVNVDSEGRNIIGDAANEPTIAIDPNNRQHLAIGWRQFETVKSNFREAGLAISKTGGEVWNILEPLEPGVFRTDPVLATNDYGGFYYNSQATGPVCDIFSSHDLSNWSFVSNAYGGDKAWMTIDQTDLSTAGNLYVYWNANYSSCEENSFTYSVSGGVNFDSCHFVPDNPHWGTLATGTNGEVYLFGRAPTSLRILRSDAPTGNRPIAWDLNTKVDLKGILDGYTGPNPGGMMGQAWVTADPVEEGHIYVLASVQRTDITDPADVMFAISTDHGATWSDAVRINDDDEVSHWQWFGTMSVAPDGRLDVVWLDTRDNPGTYLSALYYSSSSDGGVTWSRNARLSDVFDPHVGWPNQEKIGDYYHMVSTIDGAHLAWAATFNDEQDIYYSFIENITSTSTRDAFVSPQLPWLTVTPNPATESAVITVHMSSPALICIDLLDMHGRIIREVVATELEQVVTLIPLDVRGLAAGMYLLRSQSQHGKAHMTKMIVVRE